MEKQVTEVINNAYNIPYEIFECSTIGDMNNINKEGLTVGSRCFVFADSRTYIFTADKMWKKIPEEGAAGGNDGVDGLPGAKGEKGDPGVKGDKGETGAAGKDGATFTPFVNPAGFISWENDKGLPNPETKSIKGPPPVRGVDYWTTADQQAIVQQTLAALPTWNGGSF